MTTATRTPTTHRPRTSTVDRILTLIDDCLADVDPPRHPSAGPPSVIRPDRWATWAHDGNTAA